MVWPGVAKLTKSDKGLPPRGLAEKWAHLGTAYYIQYNTERSTPSTHGRSGTGVQDERQLDRRKAASRAWPAG
jgi:hypothetical protein